MRPFARPDKREQRSLLRPNLDEESSLSHWLNSPFIQSWRNNPLILDNLYPERATRSPIARLCEDGFPKMPLRLLRSFFLMHGTALMVSNLAYSFVSDFVQGESVQASLDPNHPAVKTAIVFFTIFAGASVGSLYLMLSHQAMDRLNYHRAAIHYYSIEGSRSALLKMVFKKAFGALWAIGFAGFATYTWLGLEYRVFQETLEGLFPQTWYTTAILAEISLSRMVGGTIARSVALEEIFFILLKIKNKLLKTPPTCLSRWKLSAYELQMLRVQKTLAASLQVITSSPPERIQTLFVENAEFPFRLIGAMVQQIQTHHKVPKHPWIKKAGNVGLAVGFVLGARSSQLFWDVTSAGAAVAGSALDWSLKVLNMVGSGGLFVPKMAMTLQKTAKKITSCCLPVAEQPQLLQASASVSYASLSASFMWYVGLVFWVGGCAVASGLSRLKAFTETNAPLDLIIIGLISFLITEAWGAMGIYFLVTHYFKSRKYNPEIQSELRSFLFKTEGAVSVMSPGDLTTLEQRSLSL